MLEYFNETSSAANLSLKHYSYCMWPILHVHKSNILASKGGSTVRANFQKEGVNLKI